MSRVSASSGSIDYVEDRGWPPLFLQQPYRRFATAEYNHSLTRSDVVKHQFDSLNWRSPGPYSADVIDIEYWTGNRVRHYYDYTGVKRYVQYESGGFGGHLLENRRIPENLKVFPPSLTARAVNKALLRARDQKVNLAMAFAEMQRSQDMITSRVTQLYRSYKAARKGNLKQAARELGIGKSKRNARTWLELQYGWLPLLSDIHGAYEEISRTARTNGLLMKITSNVSEPVSSSFNYPSATRSETLSINGVHSAKVSLWYTVTYENLQAASRVGLTNPAELAWELLPWSFVIDWLLPVGDFLGALTATNGLTFKSGTLTTYSRLDMIGKCKFTGGKLPSGERYDDKGEASCSEAYMKMRRTVYTGSPAPTLYIKNPFSVGHTLNAIALLRSIL